MARIVDEDDYVWHRRGKEEFYPYDEWTDGKARILVRGVDFDATIEVASVLAAIRKGMTRRGYRVSGHPINNDEVLFKAVRRNV